VDRRRHEQWRRRQGPDAGGIAWLVDQVTGDLADAIARDLFSDRREFDELGWRGLWAYVTAAQPGTAIYHKRFEGWTLGDHLAAEQLNVQRRLYWRYGAVHFEGGAEQPFPDPIPRPGDDVEPVDTGPTWDNVTAIEDVFSPQVLTILKGA
jgi:hypothetical protein